MTEIGLENISKTYLQGATQVTALADISLTIQPGEFFFLLGPSGCGKTTLLRIVAGLVEPTAGRVCFNGRDVTGLPVEKRNTAMVFQNYALWPHMTVRQNVEFGPRMKNLPKARRQEIALESLARVQMEEATFLRRKPTQLSGGQQQRVALARALAAQGDCLLLDEPLSNLDARLRLHMRGQLREMVKATGMTAVYVTHDQKEALSMADRIAVMDAGRIIQVAPPRDLYNRPATRFVADFLGEANFLTGHVVALEHGQREHSQKIIGGKVVSSGTPTKVQTAVGTVVSSAPTTAAVGADVTVCIRPEQLSITPAGDAGPAAEGMACCLAATVESSTYLGEIRQYVCRVGDAQWRISKLADNAPPLPAGQAVKLCATADNVIVLTE